jgi:hypothetical protein
MLFWAVLEMVGEGCSPAESNHLKSLTIWRGRPHADTHWSTAQVKDIPSLSVSVLTLPVIWARALFLSRMNSWSVQTRATVYMLVIWYHCVFVTVCVCFLMVLFTHALCVHTLSKSHVKQAFVNVLYVYLKLHSVKTDHHDPCLIVLHCCEWRHFPLPPLFDISFTRIGCLIWIFPKRLVKILHAQQAYTSLLYYSRALSVCCSGAVMNGPG